MLIVEVTWRRLEDDPPPEDLKDEAILVTDGTRVITSRWSYFGGKELQLWNEGSGMLHEEPVFWARKPDPPEVGDKE